MTDTTTQELYAEAILGKDVEEWLQSDVGRYALAGVEREEQEALEALAKVWPWRWRRIMQLQERLRRCRQFKCWMAEMITTGRQALQQLEE